MADAGGSAEVVALDVTDDASRRSVVQQLFDAHGDAFDILANVAGIDRPGYVTDIDLADYQRVQAVNCEGPVFLTSEFVKRVQHLPVIPAAMDTPMIEQWGIPAHLMMPPSAVAEMVRYLVTLHPAAFVPEMQIVPRLEPNFPR